MVNPGDSGGLPWSGGVCGQLPSHLVQVTECPEPQLCVQDEERNGNHLPEVWGLNTLALRV